VNCWDQSDWQEAGFDLFRLGVNKSKNLNQKS
jgi:hypothetical protein